MKKMYNREQISIQNWCQYWKWISIFIQSNYSKYKKFIEYICIFICIILILSRLVPRKVLKERFETSAEPDEPLRNDLEDLNDDNLYDDDQFYKESEAIPPAPKQQRPSEIPSVISSSSISPPLPARDDSTTLEGKFYWKSCHFSSFLVLGIST